MSGTEEASAPAGPVAPPLCALRKVSCFGSSFCAVAVAAAAFFSGCFLSTLLRFASSLDGGEVLGIAFLCSMLAIILQMVRNIWRILRALILGMRQPPNAARRKRAIICSLLGFACFAPSVAFVMLLAFNTDEISVGDVAHFLVWVLRSTAVAAFGAADCKLRGLRYAEGLASERLKLKAALLLASGVLALAAPALMRLLQG